MISAKILPVALLALAPTLAAQFPAGYTHQSKTVGMPWPPSIGAGGDFEDVVVGRFESFLYDAIVLKGGELGHVHWLGVADSITPIATAGTVTAITQIPRGNLAAQPHDALLYAGDLAGALAVATWDPATQQLQTTLHAMPEWWQARLLDGAPSATSYDLVAVAADGQTVLRGEYGAALSHVSGAWVPEPVEEVVLADIDGDGTNETFARTSAGVHVLSRAGGLVTTHLATMPGQPGALCRMDGRVAWAQTTGGGYELSFLVGGATITTWATLPATYDIATMRFAELDKAGQTDLIMAQTTTQQALAVQLSVDDDALLADLTPVDLSATPLAAGQPSQRVMAVGDFDGDLYGDLVTVVGSSVTVVLGWADILGAAPPIEPILHPNSVFDNRSQPTNGSLYLRLQGDLFNEYADVQVVLWCQPEGEPLELDEPEWNHVYEIVLGGPDDSQSLCIDPIDGIDSGYFHMLVRFVGEPVSGDFPEATHFVLSGAARDAELTGAEYETVYGYLGSIQEPGATIMGVSAPGGNQPPFSPGRILLGGLVRAPIIDPPDAGQPPPVIGDPNTGKTTVPITPGN